MPANKTIRFGPVALTTTLTTNIINCNVTSLAGPIGFTMTQPFLILNHVRIVNKTTSAASVSLWLGATGANAAGTEILNGYSVPANSYIELGDILRMDVADFLVGGAGTATALTFLAEGTIGLI